MKKFYLLSALLLSVVFTNAQTIGAGAWPANGTVVNYSEADATGVTPGNSGANQTWDFSNIITIGSSGSYSYMSSASTPYAASFPSANHSEVTSDGVNPPSYAYYNINNSTAEFIGLAFNEQTSNVYLMFPYANPLTMITYPMSLSTTFTDTYSAYLDYSPTGMNYQDYRAGSVSVTCDGSGTIITPAGTFTNILRVHTVDDVRDSVYYMGTSLISVSHSDNYSWVTTNGTNVMQLSNSSSSSSTTQTLIYSDASVGVKDVTSGILNVYPNPAVNTSTVHFELTNLKAAAAYFVAYDSKGSIVKDFDFNINSLSNKTLDVDLSTLPAGIYMARVSQGNAVYTTKLVVE